MQHKRISTKQEYVNDFNPKTFEEVGNTLL